MDNTKLIYFSGCPNAQQARNVLLELKIEFDIILQEELPVGNPYLRYSSPTILHNDKIITGYLHEDGCRACTVESISESLVLERLKYLRSKQD